MNFFSKIPDSLCLVILGEWCDYKSAAKVDSAFCNRNSRNWYLRLLPQIQFETNLVTFEWDVKYVCNRKFLEWVSIRHVQLAAAIIVGTTNFDLLFACKNITNRIEHLTFSEQIASVQACKIMIEKCPKLTSLTLRWIPDLFRACEVLLSLHSNTLAKLTRIVLSDLPISLELLVRITQVCKQLRYLRMSVDSFSCITQNEIILLLTANRNIEDLTIKRLSSGNHSHYLIGSELLTCMSNNLCKLQRMYIEDCGEFTGLEISNLFKNCPNLTDFIIFSTFYCEIRFHTTLNLSKNISISSYINFRDLATIFALQTHQFASIDLSQIDDLSDTVLNTIANNQHMLLDLTIDLCGNKYTASALQNILLKCGNLHSLDLIGVTHLTNEEVLSIFTIENKLEKLYLHNHATLTTDTVIEIMEANNKHLHNLSIVRFDKVEQQKLQTLYGTKISF